MTIRSGLIAEYLFDDAARDTSGHDRHGVVHGAVPTTDRFGRSGRALRFDGADDHVVVSPPPPLGPAFSLSVWAQYDVAPESGWSGCIACQDDGNDDDQSRRIFQLSTFGPHVVWHRMCRARDLIFKRRVQSGTWYHLAVVVSDGVQRLYADGALQDSREYDDWSTHEAQPIHIGRKGTDEPFFFFRGAIDDLRLYDRALTPAEIDELFHEGGFKKQAITIEGALSGDWGRGAVTFLELAESGGAVAGRVMSGRPDNMASIRTGTFDRRTGALVLEGEARRPDRDEIMPYRVDGLLDGSLLTVSYRFGPFEGIETFTKAGPMQRMMAALARWWFSFRRR